MTDRSKGIKFSESVRMKGTRKKKKEKGVGRMILSDAHEETNKFTSATGETFTQTRRMDKEMQFYLANNKGQFSHHNIIIISHLHRTRCCVHSP